MLPRIKRTFGIITYNRVEALRETLGKLSTVVTNEDEVIIVNNASTDGTEEMLAKEFPDVAVVSLPSNIGTAARNVYFPVAQGTYVWMLDDDTYPSSREMISEVDRVFERRKNIDAICVNIFLPYEKSEGRKQFATRFSGHQNTVWQRQAERGDEVSGYEGVFVAGGGMIVRREVLENIAGYDQDLFWGNEEADFGLQLWRAGCKILFLPRLANVHFLSLHNRDDVRAYELRVRNTTLVFYKHFPLPIASALSILFLLRRSGAALLYPKKFIHIAVAISQALMMISAMRKKMSKFSLRDSWRLRRWIRYAVFS